LLIYCNLGGFISSFALGVLILTDLIALWHVFFFAFTLGLASALDAPVRQAFTSEIVVKDRPSKCGEPKFGKFQRSKTDRTGIIGTLDRGSRHWSFILD